MGVQNIEIAGKCRIAIDTTKLEAKVKNEYVRRTFKATAMLQRQVVKNISVPTRTEGPSEPGEFPHADTGRLRQDVQMKVDEEACQGFVFVTVFYGLILEYYRDRSFLRRTLYEMEKELKAIFEKPLDKSGGGEAAPISFDVGGYSPSVEPV